jgi:hypothetical protein
LGKIDTSVLEKLALKKYTSALGKITLIAQVV